MAWLLVLASIPAAITGVVLDTLIEELDAEMADRRDADRVRRSCCSWADRLPGEREVEASSALRDAMRDGRRPGAGAAARRVAIGRHHLASAAGSASTATRPPASRSS